MSSELQLDVRHLNRWRRHLVNAYEVKAGMMFVQVKLCDPYLSALNRFVYHTRHYISALLCFFAHPASIGPCSQYNELEAKFNHVFC